jgi:hypothetical protein
MIVLRVLATLLSRHDMLMLRMGVLMLTGLMMTALVLRSLVSLLMSSCNVIVRHHRILLAVICVSLLLRLIPITVSAGSNLMTILIRHILLRTVSLVHRYFILQHVGLTCNW